MRFDDEESGRSSAGGLTDASNWLGSASESEVEEQIGDVDDLFESDDDF